MVNRSFADMRRTPVSPASCRAFFSLGVAGIFAGDFAYCLQRTTIDRFFTFAPKMPPTEPPEVAPLSTSFDTTS